MIDQVINDLKDQVSNISKLQDKPIKFVSVKGFTCKLEELKGYKEADGKTVVWFSDSSVLLNFSFEEFDKAVRALNG